MAQQFNRLTPHTAQILALKGAGASIAEIQRWLRARRIRVDESTIRRFWSRVHTQAPQSLSLPDFDAAAEVLLLKAQTLNAARGVVATQATFKPSINLSAIVGLAAPGLGDLFSSKK